MTMLLKSLSEEDVEKRRKEAKKFKRSQQTDYIGLGGGGGGGGGGGVEGGAAAMMGGSSSTSSRVVLMASERSEAGGDESKRGGGDANGLESKSSSGAGGGGGAAGQLKQGDREEKKFTGTGRLKLKNGSLTLSVPKPLLKRVPDLTVHRGDLSDAHFYVFSRWVLDLLEDAEAAHIDSVKNDLIPFLVDLQFRPLGEQPPAVRRAHAERHGLPITDSEDGGGAGGAGAGATVAAASAMAGTPGGVLSTVSAAIVGGSDGLGLPGGEFGESKGDAVAGIGGGEGEPGGGSFMSSSSKSGVGGGGGASGGGGISLVGLDAVVSQDGYVDIGRMSSRPSGTLAPPAATDVVRCFAMVLDPGPLAGYCARARNLARYTAMNREITRFPVSASSPWKPDRGEPTKFKDCVVGAGCELGENLRLKEVVMGEHTKVGDGCKINNSVIMDHVKIGKDCIIQNCIVSSGATIAPGSRLNDCQVGYEYAVPSNTQAKGQALSRSSAAADDDEGFD